MSDDLRLGAEEARTFATAVLTRAGFSADDVRDCTDLLVETSLRGVDSHGIVALLGLFAEQAQAGYGGGRAPAVERTAGAILRVDGNGASGPRAIRTAERAASELAREHGLALAVVRNLGYVGALGWTVLPPARAGLITIAACNAVAFVVPHGGRQALHGTNPIAVGIPAAPDPIVLDMRTNAFQMSDYWRSVATGEPLPEGALMLEDGTPLTDVGELERLGWDGVVSLPLAGARGYGLALAVDVLTAVLAGMPVARDVESPHEAEGLAAFVLAIDPGHAGAGDTFAAGIERLAEQVHATLPIADDRPVLLPGERAAREARARAEQGIPVDPVAWQRLCERVAGLGVDPPRLEGQDR